MNSNTLDKVMDIQGIERDGFSYPDEKLPTTMKEVARQLEQGSCHEQFLDKPLGYPSRYPILSLDDIPKGATIDCKGVIPRLVTSTGGAVTRTGRSPDWGIPRLIDFSSLMSTGVPNNAFATLTDLTYFEDGKLLGYLRVECFVHVQTTEPTYVPRRQDSTINGFVTNYNVGTGTVETARPRKNATVRANTKQDQLLYLSANTSKQLSVLIKAMLPEYMDDMPLVANYQDKSTVHLQDLMPTPPRTGVPKCPLDSHKVRLTNKRDSFSPAYQTGVPYNHLTDWHVKGGTEATTPNIAHHSKPLQHCVDSLILSGTAGGVVTDQLRMASSVLPFMTTQGFNWSKVAGLQNMNSKFMGFTITADTMSATCLDGITYGITYYYYSGNLAAVTTWTRDDYGTVTTQRLYKQAKSKSVYIKRLYELLEKEAQNVIEPRDGVSPPPVHAVFDKWLQHPPINANRRKVPSILEGTSSATT